MVVFFFQAEDGIRDLVRSRGLGDVYKRQVSTSSRVLFDALSAVFADLGFAVVGDAVFQDLVISRIVEPTSLLDAGRVLTDLGRSSASYSTMKRTLRRARTSGYRDQVAAACFTHAATAGDISPVSYTHLRAHETVLDLVCPLLL